MLRLILVTLLFTTQAALAWGPMGHKIVAEVAETNLTPQALAAVKKLIQKQTMADVATWADTIRNQTQWEHTKTWHYVSIEDGETYEDSAKNPEGDVVEAVNSYVNTLKNPSAAPNDQLEALKFLIHFIGDIHQPLHVGRTDDRGGNEIHVKFKGKGFNLHALWDSGLIECQQIGIKDYAIKLQKESVPTREAPEFNYVQIVEENMALRKQVYEFKQPDLSGEYFDKNLAALNNRLLLGGKRLAFILNTIYK